MKRPGLMLPLKPLEPSHVTRGLWARGLIVLLESSVWVCCRPLCGERAIWAVPGRGHFCDEHTEVVR